MRRVCSSCASCWLLLCIFFFACSEKKQEPKASPHKSVNSKKKAEAAEQGKEPSHVLAGHWRGVMTLEGEGLEPKRVPFEFHIAGASNKSSVLLNGGHKIKISSVSLEGDQVEISFDAFQTKIKATLAKGKPRTLQGEWTLPWADSVLRFPFSATQGKNARFGPLPQEEPLAEATIAALPSVQGLWEVTFPQEDGSKKKCGARFTQEEGEVRGTLVAPTGDYGHLAGVYTNGRLRLSYFDGAFAYIVEAEAMADGRLRGAGQFNLFRQEFTAQKIKDGELKDTLPQCAEITEWSGKDSVLSLRFTDLKGKEFALADANLTGKVVLLDLFGTWCPNCHELVPLLKTWHEKYQQEGLEIIGVSFEFADGQSTVSAYRDKYEIPYRLLVGAAPQNAAEVMPQLSLTSFPTLVLVGRDGKIHNIQTGFRGLATGEFRKAGAIQYEERIKKLLTQE